MFASESKCHKHIIFFVQKDMIKNKRDVHNSDVFSRSSEAFGRLLMVQLNCAMLILSGVDFQLDLVICSKKYVHVENWLIDLSNILANTQYTF